MATLTATLTFYLGGDPFEASPAKKTVEAYREDFIRMTVRYRLKTNREEQAVDIQIANPNGGSSG